MRWFDNITNSTDISLSKLQAMVKDREDQRSPFHGVTELDKTQRLNDILFIIFCRLICLINTGCLITVKHQNYSARYKVINPGFYEGKLKLRDRVTSVSSGHPASDITKFCILPTYTSFPLTSQVKTTIIISPNF